MRRIVLILTMMSVWLGGYSQERTALEARIEKWKQDMADFNAGKGREDKKESAVDTVKWAVAYSSLADSSFVVEADAVTFKYGTRVSVNSSTNFISVKGDLAVVQISPATFSGGPNGVGGITLEGRISNVEMTTDKKGRVRYSMNVVGRALNATVSLTLIPGTDRVQAEVSPTFNSNDVRLDGVIVPYSASRVIEGISL